MTPRDITSDRMKRSFTDSRGIPGDLVLIRGTNKVTMWSVPSRGNGDGTLHEVVAHIPGGTLGIIVAIHSSASTYVIMSNPAVCGWIDDGHLKKVSL